MWCLGSLAMPTSFTPTTFWMLGIPAHSSLQQNTSFSLKAQILLQFEMMFRGFSRQFCPVPSSAIWTCTHKRWLADANVVLLYPWSCPCRGLRNPLFRHFVYLPGWQIGFHTLCFHFRHGCRNTYFLPDFYLAYMKIYDPALLLAVSQDSNFWLSRYYASLHFWPAGLIVFTHARCNSSDHILSVSSCMSCTTGNLFTVWLGTLFLLEARGWNLGFPTLICLFSFFFFSHFPSFWCHSPICNCHYLQFLTFQPLP